MWPSMQSNRLEPGVKGPKIPLDFNRSLDEIDSEDEEKESMLQELLQGSKLPASPLSREDQSDETGEGEVDDDDQEFMAQMKAIILDAEMKNRRNAWVSVSAPSSTTTMTSELTMSPTEMNGENSMSPFERHLDLKFKDAEEEAGKKHVSLRFEDDFSVFVSAPPQDGEEKTVGWTALDSTGLMAPDGGGFRYRTLGSVSDFGEGDDGRDETLYQKLDDEDSGSGGEDEDMPSKKEIKGTARKIFGAVPRMVNQGEDGGPFDLEQVFGVLQEYKTEIASMENEEEKRKMAARVALGLVYGLEGA